MIASVDEFILYDDMQYTRRDWRNRNQIKTPQGVQWLTVPVQVKGRYDQKIRDTQIDPKSDWAELHWKALEQNYRRAPHFEEIAAWLKPIYTNDVTRGNLSQLNRTLIEAIAGYLGIETKLTWSWDYTLVDGKTERLADLCAQAGGTTYVSGPSAKDYVDGAIFESRGIVLEWFDYAGYPEYPQLWGEYTHGVSILDLLFNCGNVSPRYMKHVQS